MHIRSILTDWLIETNATDVNVDDAATDAIDLPIFPATFVFINPTVLIVRPEAYAARRWVMRKIRTVVNEFKRTENEPSRNVRMCYRIPGSF